MTAPPIEVVVFLRDGCHLCADALADLEALRSREPFSIRTVDIERDDRLHARYLERIPVVAVAGEELCDFAVDAERVLAAVRDVQRRRAAVGGVEGTRRNSTATPLSAVAARRIAAQPLRPISRTPAPVLEVDAVSTTEIESGGEGDDTPEVPEVRLGVGQAERLSRYLQTLTQARKMGRATMSSQELSAHTHVNSTQIRRDLSGFGRFGKRGVGYDVGELVDKIRSILHTSTHVGIVLLGAGHLGRAIAGSDTFADHGFDVVAVLDNDPAKIGTPIGDLTIGDVRHLVDVVRDNEVVVGVIASPAKAAQGLADELVDAGVQIIFNYSGTLLRTPPEVTVHTSSPAVDLLHALYYYLA
ncbi:redox-sensing transcriptional repressor Rex [Patulibacter minatonensis]|uniref:redox-sensing transcriptional repressor Rex n=1 Tax=Patulibacter minatonensis TaxID=298163 RepID=UPI000A05309D|nr:redox-sensing transcriptional repressor Rex [Patulibacter minatonensis]